MKARRDSWWSHMSLANGSIVAPVTSKTILRKSSSYSDLKKKFFSGNDYLKTSTCSFSLILNADSKFKLIWDIFIILTALYLAYAVPYSLSFFIEISINNYYISSAIFITDIVITFNTNFYCEGTLIIDRKKIALVYLKTDFFIDLLSAFPFELFLLHLFYLKEDFPYIFSSPEKYLKTLLLLKILKLHKFPKVIYQLNIHFPQSSAYSLIKMCNYLIIATIPAHWLACVYNLIYCYSLSTEAVYWDLAIFDSRSRYIKLLEEVIETMTSVGYGDVRYHSFYSKIFSILVMSFTSGFLGTIVGGITHLAERSSAVDQFFREMTRQFHLYMTKHSVPKDLRLRGKEYIRFLKTSYHKHLIKEQDIIEMLSLPLREQIFLYTRGYILTKISQIKELSDCTLRALGYKLDLKFYAINDFILREEETTSELFIIFDGSVSVLHEKTRTEFAILKKGNFFGEISFFTEKPRCASVVAKEFSEIFSLSRKDFKKIIGQVPRDHEKMKTLARNLNNYGLAIIGVKCFLCKKIGHVAAHCNKNKCKPKMKKIIQKVNESKKVNRRFEFKRLEKNVNFLSDYSIIRAKGIPNTKNLEEIEDRKYLKKNIFRYKHLVENVKSENIQLFTLVNELDENENLSESDSSEKNFMRFSFTKLGEKSIVTSPINSFHF